MTTENSSSWEAFYGLQRLSQYGEEQLEAFTDSLFSSDDEESLLTDYADIQRYIEVLEAIKAKIKPVINQIVLNQPKSVEINGYRFTYRPQVKYKYEEVELWRKANESVKINQEYQKQIEETCKKGGRIDGVEIPKVNAEITDNFTMTKLT